MTNTAPLVTGQAPPLITDPIFQVMKFVVVPLVSPDLSQINVPSPFDRLNPLLSIRQRQLILDVFPGAPPAHELLLQNRFFMDPVEEKPVLGSYETWQFINMKTGAHPIHIHLIQFQVLHRRPFNAVLYAAAITAANPGLLPGQGYPVQPDVTPFYSGPAVPVTGTIDDGWKDTVRVPGGAPISFVTTVLIHFGPQYPGKTAFPFDARITTPTSTYVYHCRKPPIVVRAVAGG
jgi:spore coat protein A